jgi:hypothetical protein
MEGYMRRRTYYTFLGMGERTKEERMGKREGGREGGREDGSHAPFSWSRKRTSVLSSGKMLLHECKAPMGRSRPPAALTERTKLGFDV